MRYARHSSFDKKHIENALWFLLSTAQYPDSDLNQYKIAGPCSGSFAISIALSSAICGKIGSFNNFFSAERTVFDLHAASRNTAGSTTPKIFILGAIVNFSPNNRSSLFPPCYPKCHRSFQSSRKLHAAASEHGTCITILAHTNRPFSNQASVKHGLPAFFAQRLHPQRPHDLPDRDRWILAILISSLGMVVKILLEPFMEVYFIS